MRKFSFEVFETSTAILIDFLVFYIISCVKRRQNELITLDRAFMAFILIPSDILVKFHVPYVEDNYALRNISNLELSFDKSIISLGSLLLPRENQDFVEILQSL